MRFPIFAAVVLFASPLLAAPPTPVAFETIVDLDSFRITNKSPTATIILVKLYPKSIDVGAFTESEPNEMDVARMESRPGEDFTWWGIAGGWTRDRWTEFAWTPAPAILDVWFAQFTGTGSQFGLVRAEALQSGINTYSGFTVPEPSTAALCGMFAAALAVAVRRRRVAGSRTELPPT